MSELNFPKNPIVGQEYTFNSLLYMFDGVKWVTKGTGYNPVQDLYEMLASDAGASFVGANGYDNVQAALEAVDTNLQAQIDTKINADFVSKFDRESLRRSYAEAGHTLVAGSFELGGTVSDAIDVLLYEADGKAYSYSGTLPHTASSGSSPSAEPGMWVDMSTAPNAFKQAGTGAALRTAQDKMREKITPEDFLATGDGVADDTASFNTLEASHKGKTIDLLGLSYKVTALPRKNNYVNGAFVISNTINYSGSPYVYNSALSQGIAWPIQSTIDVKRDLQPSRSKLIFQIQGSDDDAAGSNDLVIQDFCFDEINNHLYTHHRSKDQTKGYVQAYSLAGAGTGYLTLLGTSAASSIIGLSGISVEYQDNGTVFLWSSVNPSYGADSGRQGVRFKYAGNGAAITDVQVYTLFRADQTGYAANTTSPRVSYCGRYLLALGRPSTRRVLVRVFDLRTLVQGGAGDYSDKYLYEWEIDEDILADNPGGTVPQPKQGMVSDGAFVYILAGSSSITEPKHVHCYTLDGQRVAENDKVIIGQDIAASFMEPQGLAICSIFGQGKPSLVYHTVTLAGQKRNDFFITGDSSPVTHRGTRSGLRNTAPQCDWHIARGAAAKIVGLSPSLLDVKQNDAGNAFSALICKNEDSSLARYTFGHASDYANGQLTYRLGPGDGLYYMSMTVNGSAHSYFEEASGVKSFIPGTDNTHSLGKSSRRWSVVYAGTGTINTSDAREKTAPMQIDDAVLDAWGDVHLITFQWLESIRLKGEDGARWHFGVIAQQVRDAFAAHGLDGTRYGLLCYDEWEDQFEQVIGDDGEPTGEMKLVVVAGNRWGIRPDQCLFLEAAYQRRNYQRLLARVEALEAK